MSFCHQQFVELKWKWKWEKEKRIWRLELLLSLSSTTINWTAFIYLLSSQHEQNTRYKNIFYLLITLKTCSFAWKAHRTQNLYWNGIWETFCLTSSSAQRVPILNGFLVVVVVCLFRFVCQKRERKNLTAENPFDVSVMRELFNRFYLLFAKNEKHVEWEYEKFNLVRCFWGF